MVETMGRCDTPKESVEKLLSLKQNSCAACVETLAIKVWSDHITNMIQTAAFKWNEDNQSIIHAIRV